jgi:hypothetical protein
VVVVLVLAAFFIFWQRLAVPRWARIDWYSPFSSFSYLSFSSSFSLHIDGDLSFLRFRLLGRSTELSGGRR